MSKLRLTYADNKTGGVFSLNPISKNGKLIFLGYNAIVTGSPAVELFENDSGTLKSLWTYPLLGDNFNTSTAAASPNYNLFVVIDSNNEEARIQILDINGHLIRQKSYEVKLGRSVLGGEFSKDGRFFTLRYMIDPPSTNDRPQRSIMRILRTSTLETVASVIYDGFANSASFVYVDQKKKLYIAVASSIVETDANGTPIKFLPPATLRIYNFNERTGSLTRLTTVNLPNFPDIMTVNNFNNKDKGAWIAVNTRPAYLKNEIIPWTEPAPTTFTFLPGDGAEFRIYEFNGKDLCLIGKKDHNHRGDGIVISEDRKLLVEIERLQDNTSSTLYLYNITHDKPSFKLISDTATVGPVSYTVGISRDNKWLIVGSLFQTGTINDIFLYKIKN